MKLTYPIIMGMMTAGTLAAGAKDFSLASPDGILSATVSDKGTITLSVEHEGRTLIAPSPIGMEIKGAARTTPATIKKVKTVKNRHEDITAPFYRQDHFDVTYNEAIATLSDGMTLTVRAYDDGIAYRFSGGSKKNSTIVVNETMELNLPSTDTNVLLSYSTNDANPKAMAFQNFYDHTPIGHAKDKLAFLPATVDYGDGLKLTLLESDVEAYPSIFVKADTVAGALKAEFAQYPATTDYYPWRVQEYVTSTHDYIARHGGVRDYPWRVMAVTTDDTQMPVNNLVYALASPSRIGDTSWIKPGKVAWDWWNDWGLAGVPFKAGINMDTYKYYIDFAAANGIEYIVLDEGWYDPRSGDMLTVIPDIDLEALIAYGKERGVDIVLWTVFNVLDSQLEEACERYSAMGIKGFKVDFLDRNDQTAAEMTYRIAEAAARHGLTLDLHGFYTPTGLNRTYPNILNFESVFGMEEMKWSDPSVDMPRYDVTFPYIRMMAGPVDYTPGAMVNGTRKEWRAHYYNPMSQGTRAHQLATYIVHDSPFTMLADSPTNYEREQECVTFIASLPVVFEETRIIDGRLGEYIVTARREGPAWYVGGMTDWTPRDIDVDMSFLPAGRDYMATIFMDGINADKQAEDYRVETIRVNSSSRVPVSMASGGGFAMKIYPLSDKPVTVTGIPSTMMDRIPSFYSKYADADGLYVTASSNVADEAIERAAEVASLMLMKRPDIRRHMVDRGCHMLIIGKDEQTCDIPEYQGVCTDDPDSIAYINWRARGFGGAPEDDLSSGCGEENVLALPGDKYTGESILVHEFSHLIQQIGISETDPGFDARLEALWKAARDKGLWEGTYAISQPAEYWAEAVQSFFNCNRYSETPNGVHNNINRRAKLKVYDPDMYDLLCEYFYPIDLPLANKIHD